MKIRNTATDPHSPMLVLLEAMGNRTGDGSAAIEAMEAAGQRQLVNSDRLPTNSGGSGDVMYLALGFTFGDPDPSDPLFRPATLPAGWTRQGSDHAMHSYLLDQHGRRRVNVFYKAAFYDRRADMNLISRSWYLQTCLYDGTTPILDDEWLTAATAREELEQIALREEERAGDFDRGAKRDGNTYWTECATKARAEAAKARALAATLSAS